MKNNEKIENILNSILNVDTITLNSIDTSFIREITPIIGNGLTKYEIENNVINKETDDYYHQESGREHYRLLLFISSLLNREIIFDVGTNYALSAISLSRNLENKVFSYDIIDKFDQNFKENKLNFDNLEFIIGDCREDKRLHECSFIFFDAEHDGIFENQFYNHLVSINWKGLLLLDDIHLNSPMSSFWNNINQQDKYDLTNKGHWTGTGIVHFK
jgi:hypothetical protein